MHDTQKAVRLVRSVREGFLGMRDVLWHGVLKKKARFWREKTQSHCDINTTIARRAGRRILSFSITTGGNLLYPRQQTMMVVNSAKRARVQRERERESGRTLRREV